MPNNSELVQPKSAAPVVEPTQPAADAPQASAGSLPDTILQLPAMQGIFAGQPAAVSATLADFAKREEGKLIAQNKDALMKAGINFYRSLDGGTGVVFNAAHVSGEEIQAADKAGQLAQIAPNFDQVNSSIAQSGGNNPVLNAQSPSGFKTAPVPAAPQANSAVPPASANTQRQAMEARVTNMKPLKPTEGQKPGGGRLLASILKPVV